MDAHHNTILTERTTFLTEFNWISTPSHNYIWNPGWHRKMKPVAYRMSCCNHSPHLNIPRSFKIVIYLILEHIFTLVALTHSPGSLFHSCIVRWENAYFLMSSVHRYLANAQLRPRVLLFVLYLKNLPLAKPCVILKTCIWSPQTLLFPKLSIYTIVLDLHNWECLVPELVLLLCAVPFLTYLDLYLQYQVWRTNNTAERSIVASKYPTAVACSRIFTHLDVAIRTDVWRAVFTFNPTTFVDP